MSRKNKIKLDAETEEIRLRRTIGVKEFLGMKFKSLPFEGPWKDSFGFPETNFKLTIYGDSGNGKTEFCLQLAKMMCQFTKVYYNSFEQGKSQTLQDAYVRQNMLEVDKRLYLGDREDFDEMRKRLRSKNPPGCIVIDSRDDLDMTYRQWKRLCDENPTKAIITVLWRDGNRPRGEHGRAILYKSDIKCEMKDYYCYPRSRFGGNLPFNSWPNRPVKIEETTNQ